MGLSRKELQHAGRRVIVAALVAAACALVLALAGQATVRGKVLPDRPVASLGVGHDLLRRSPFDSPALAADTLSRAAAPASTPEAQDVSIPDRCAGCHAPPTRYHFGLACGQCHSASRFVPAKVDVPEHPIPLVGQHAVLRCKACHAQAQPAGTACTSCHSAPQDHLAGTCATCHTPQGWAESAASAGITGPAAPHRLDTEDDCLICHAPGGPNWPAPPEHASYSQTQCLLCHGSSGKASVTVDHSQVVDQFRGEHAVLDCARCHSSGQFEGTASACAACHQEDDQHAGQFGQDCSRCHNPEGWAGASFNHGQTGFPLAGAHASVGCTGCHSGGVFAGTPRNCVACHQADDQHGGQLGQDCARCHNPSGWANVSFDHGQTSFPLTGAHSGAACTSCHSGGVFAGTPRECVACHGEPAFHAGVLGTDCAACHNTTGWLPASFAGAHTFPLNHKGASGCRTCHPDSLAAYTCYACHNPNEIREEHLEHGIPNYSNCVACHPTGSGA